MTNFRPTSLSPEALEAWDEAEANIEASMQRIRELTAPLRRPKPQNLKEQALAVIENSEICDHLSTEHAAILRRALEQLDD